MMHESWWKKGAADDWLMKHWPTHSTSALTTQDSKTELKTNSMFLQW